MGSDDMVGTEESGGDGDEGSGNNCNGGRNGKYVSWRPYLELLNFMKDVKVHRMSYFFLIDTPEGEAVEKQLHISIQEWSKKFKVLSTLPFNAKTETVPFFKEIAKSNKLPDLVTNLLKETKDAILADLDKEKNPKDAEVELKEMVKEWEKLREFLNGMQRFEENLENDDADGSAKSKKEAEKAATASPNATCWVASYHRGFGKLVHACPNGKEAGAEASEKPASAVGKDKSFSNDSHSARSGLLCYPPCKEGYGGLGPLCWTSCTSGFKNHGLWCYKPDGHWPIEEGKKKVCKDGFHKQLFGKWCSSDCPEKMADIGISC